MARDVIELVPDASTDLIYFWPVEPVAGAAFPTVLVAYPGTVALLDLEARAGQSGPGETLTKLYDARQRDGQAIGDI